MSSVRLGDPTTWWRLAYNHNPFYVISAGLVLFGLYQSFTGTVSPTDGWTILAIFCGYMLMLAAASVVIIRFGRVWEDARMILLIVVLLFVALSNSFDDIVIKDPALGGAFLTMGFCFAVCLSEAVLWGLKLRLAGRYRVPYYLQLMLVFFYPVVLSFVMRGQTPQPINEAGLAWGVLLFPLAAAATVLCLWPAARLRPERHHAGAAPWRWPAYPWSLFVVTLVALSLRTYSLSVSFEFGSGRQSGFQPYFLAPIVMAVCVLLLEIGVVTGNKILQRIGLAVPLGLLLLGLPLGEASEIQLRFLTMLQESIGTPTQLTLGCLFCFYFVSLLRRIRFAESGLVASALLAAIIHGDVVDVWIFSLPGTTPLLALAAYLAVLGIARRESWRVASAFALVVVACYLLGAPELLGGEFYFLTAHTFVALLLGMGLAFDDGFAAWIRSWAAWLLPAVAVCFAVVFPIALRESVPVLEQVTGQCVLVLFAVVYWLGEGRLRELMAVAATAGSLVMMAALHGFRTLQEFAVIRGLAYLAWGLAFFALALLVSLLKGGLASRLRQAIADLNGRIDEPQSSGPP